MATSKKRTRSGTKSKPLDRLRLLLSIFLVTSGVGLLTAAYDARYGSQTVPTTQVQNVFTQVDQNRIIPAKLYIPKLNRSLDVHNGSYQGDRWVVSETGVSYLASSAMPGDEGNAVMYGHNRKAILGDLESIGKDDYIFIVLSNQNIERYKVTETKEIQPTQVDILNQTEDATLTIYTCSGYLDESRFVVIAKKV